MKFKDSPFKNEVLDSSAVDEMAQARAAKRMKRIVASPSEQYLHDYAPNKARNEVDRPGMPCEDYGVADYGGGAKD